MMMVCDTGKHNSQKAGRATSGQSLSTCIADSVSFPSGATMKQIQLANNKGFALIDDEDFILISGYNLYLAERKPCFYVICAKQINKKTKHIYLHRLIMNAQRGQQIDHRDGNGLNCQKSNLRFCTQLQNTMNQRKTKGTSRYKGVSWHKQTKKWRAAIMLHRKQHHLGCFVDEIDAAKAYDKAARELFGEFALCNFPEKK